MHIIAFIIAIVLLFIIVPLWERNGGGGAPRRRLGQSQASFEREQREREIKRGIR